MTLIDVASKLPFRLDSGAIDAQLAADLDEALKSNPDATTDDILQLAFDLLFDALKVDQLTKADYEDGLMKLEVLHEWISGRTYWRQL